MELKQAIAEEIANGIVSTGVEGPFDAVSKSSAGDYPSIGVSQWEGVRADNLLSRIQGGEKFRSRGYYDIVDAGELEELKRLLGSEEGKQAQLTLLAADCLRYVEALQQVEKFYDTRCVIYAGIWCPTSTSVVQKFLLNRNYKYDLENLETLRDVFAEEYWKAAGVGCRYFEGYRNRAMRTYDYVNNIDMDAFWRKVG